MAEPVSWFLIESGWSVVDRSGAEVGEVAAVLGDEDADIFHGPHVRGGEPGGAEITRDRDAEL